MISSSCCLGSRARLLNLTVGHPFFIDNPTPPLYDDPCTDPRLRLAHLVRRGNFARWAISILCYNLYLRSAWGIGGLTPLSARLTSAIRRALFYPHLNTVSMLRGGREHDGRCLCSRGAAFYGRGRFDFLLSVYEVLTRDDSHRLLVTTLPGY